MSAHYNSDNLLHLYEGDQSKLYSGVLAHHGDEASSKKTSWQDPQNHSCINGYNYCRGFGRSLGSL